jgi:prevent-host-death family protein
LARFRESDNLKTIRYSDVVRRWNSIIKSVGDDGEIIVVEHFRKPTAAFIPYEMFEELQELKQGDVTHQAEPAL